MAHVTRIKADDKKSEEKPQSTSKNIKKAVKIAKTIVKEQKETSKVKTKAEKSNKKPMPKALRIITAPFRFIAKPFIAFGNYIYNSWLEIRQVRWPNRKATWKLVGAIFLYAAFFIVLVAILDGLFNFIFSKIIG
jgi:preprotein translocase SecE subunit